MSTDRTGRGLRALVVSVAAGACAPAAVAGWQVQFLPAVDLRAGVTENVAITTTGAQQDVVTQLGVTLAVEADKPRTALRFFYSPQRQTFTDFGGFDNTGHFLRLTLRHQTSRDSNYTLELDARRAQTQGIDPNAVDLAVSLVPRSTQERVQLVWGADSPLSRRWRWGWRFRGAANRYENPFLEDSDEAGLLLTFARGLSTRSNVGVRYGFQVFDYETRESVASNSLGVYGTRTLDRYLEGRVGIGMFFNRLGSEIVQDPAVDLSLARNAAVGWSFRVGVRQGVSSGPGVGGASLDRAGFFSVRRPTRSGRFVLSGDANFSRRASFDPTLGDSVDVDTLLVQEELRWVFRQEFSVGVFHRYADQEQLVGGELGNLRFHSGGLFIAYTRQRRS